METYKNLSEIAKESENYKCPVCNEYHNDSDTGYDVDGTHYPKYYNEQKGGNGNGNYHDWDELHKCQCCGTTFYFSNGAY